MVAGLPALVGSGGLTSSGGNAGPSEAALSQSFDSSWNVAFGNSRLDAVTAKGQQPVDMLAQYLPLLVAAGLALLVWAASRRAK